jgi:hypothetical protein
LQLLEHCELIVEAIKSYQEQGRVDDVAKFVICLLCRWFPDELLALRNLSKKCHIDGALASPLADTPNAWSTAFCALWI